MIEPWLRVWRDGRDVTLEPVETWPPYFRLYFTQGWRPQLGPGESREWPDASTIPVPSLGRSRAGRSPRG